MLSKNVVESIKTKKKTIKSYEKSKKWQSKGLDRENSDGNKENVKTFENVREGKKRLPSNVVERGGIE